ncbi:Branched-chain-amino-acid aminotransferase [Melia azedarach]|uniref:Branched-chain-amino-acid aminotransferase n=1 Tax=Melia azedarach TaxID=155640 RepID=A0ACC1XY41_MELAZ|nr:Branched-chain-amino-acid aminotransferase [Melia azedarach]
MLTSSKHVETLGNKAKSQSTNAAAVEAGELGDNHSHVNEEYAGVRWDKLRFSLTPTDYMYVMKCSKDEKYFSQGTLSPFGNIEMNPSSGILNYGQGLFEGLKAYRTEDGRILLFRPQQNALRMQMGAERMCMPSPTVEQFLNAVKQIVNANKSWVPPPEKGSLYIRPMLMGSGPNLGVAPATEYTFLTYASPVGNYHKGTLNLVVEEKFYRAFPGGTGGVKTIANYAPIYEREASTSNIFVVKGNLISTPATSNGTILPGVTRKSIIEIAHVLGYQVEERDVPVEELLDAEEVFLTGTAVVVNPVSSITYKGKRIEYKTGANANSTIVAQHFYAMLTGIQTGQIEDKMGWIVEIA